MRLGHDVPAPEARVRAALDNSAATRPVLAAALRIGTTIGATVDAVHVCGVGSPPLDAAEAVGVPLTLLTGDTGAAVVQALAAPDVVVGVIGARREAADYRFAGSTAAEIITHTRTPVMVVGPRVRPPEHARFARVLVPLDGTEASAHAVRDVAALFDAPGVDVVVHHVFDQSTVPVFWDQPQHATEGWAREFLARWYNQPGARLTWACGDAADAIVDAAMSEDADLIALAWAQDSSAGHAAVIKRALLTADVPVLLVPVDLSASSSRQPAQAIDR